MLTLDGKILLYSKTAARDYRWICIDESISYADATNMHQDFLAVLRKYSNGTGFPAHVFVRSLKNGLAFYRIVKSRRSDISGRAIFELKGLSTEIPESWDLCYRINKAVFDLLYHNRVQVDKLKDEDERLVRSFVYSFDDSITGNEDARFKIIDEEITSFFKGEKWGNGFLLTEVNGVPRLEHLAVYESETESSSVPKGGKVTAEPSKPSFFMRLFRKK